MQNHIRTHPYFRTIPFCQGISPATSTTCDLVQSLFAGSKMIDGAGVVVGMGVVEVAPARATKEHSETSIEHLIFVFLLWGTSSGSCEEERGKK